MSTKDVRENTVWEEAGGEFYQENYKGHRSNSTTTRIPLPSHTARRNSGWKTGTGAYTHRRGTTLGTGVDYNIIDGIPDLADESLGNEKSTVNQQESFKRMPISMAEKRGLKGQLQSNPTLKLMGWKGIQWRLERSLNSFIQLKRHFSYTLFAKQMWRIESRFGFVFTWYFQEIKALLILNFITALLSGSYFLIPTLVKAVRSIGLSANSTATSAASPDGDGIVVEGGLPDFSNMSTPSSLIDWKNISHILLSQQSFMYYGFTFSTPPLMIALISIYFGLSFAYCSYHTWKCLKEKIQHKHIQRSCCDLIFAGWHHFTKCRTGAEFKRAAIQREIQAFLFANCHEKNQCGLLGIRTCVNIIAVTLISICAVLTWHIQEFVQNFHSYFQGQELVQLLIYFLPQIFICSSWMILSCIIERMGKWEKYTYENRVLVLVLRLWLVRLILLAVFITRFFAMRYSHRDWTNSKKPGVWVFQRPGEQNCWEFEFAKEIYKFLLVDITLKILMAFTLEPVRALLGRVCPIGSVHFHCVTNVLDVLNIQALSWLGIYFAPFMPFAVTIHMFLLFLVKSFSLMANCRGSPDIFRPIHSLLITIKVATLIICTLVVISIFACVQPSRFCGPFQTFGTPWEYIVTSMPANMTDNLVGQSFNQLSNKYPQWSLPLLILLLCLCIYYKCVIRNGETMIDTLRHLLVLEGHDKQFLFRRVEAMQGSTSST